MIDFVPPSILVQIGPIPIHFYGLAYALGLAAAYVVMSREANRRGRSPELLANGLIVVAIAAIVGGRAYHVIDQIAYYKDHILQAFLPIDAAGNFIGFSGLGVYGGIITGTIAAWLFLRHYRQCFWAWSDIVAPGLFAMQAIGALGQLLQPGAVRPADEPALGDRDPVRPPDRQTTPARRAPTPTRRSASTSSRCSSTSRCRACSGALVLLALARRFAGACGPATSWPVFFIWYGIVRFALEALRADNWTFFGVPMAQIFSSLFILLGVVIIVLRHARRVPTLAEADASASVATDAVGAGAAGPVDGTGTVATPGLDAPEAPDPGDGGPDPAPPVEPAEAKSPPSHG